VPGYEKSSAELTSEEKNEISHRGMAVRELEKVWKTWLEGNQ
jgi:inosine/xanthosine triphosphate pyrophosphatase family protein